MIIKKNVGYINREFLMQKKKYGRIYNCLKYKNLNIDHEFILFLGFDFKYIGNSRYLFEYFIQKGKNIKFVSKDKNIPIEFRVEPESEEFFRLLSIAGVIIAESWIPEGYRKKKNQKWIQLWHGTPYKKILFDTKLSNGSIRDRNFLGRKKSEINKWDFILADSEQGKAKLASAFMYNQEKIFNFGYPRVQWLINNKKNIKIKLGVYKKIGIGKSKKILLYVPTWRDYNYDNLDEEMFLLDVEKLAELLEDYIIIVKPHPLSNVSKVLKNVNYLSDDIELQEILLVSDVVVSDYSSVIFDAITIDIPIFLYTKDFDLYARYRGVYLDIYNDLKQFEENNLNTLSEKIKNLKNPPFYDELKKKYTCINNSNTIDDLYEKIIGLTGVSD